MSKEIDASDTCSAVIDIILNGDTEQPPTVGYVLVTFDHEASISGGKLVPIVNTNTSKLVAGSIFKQLIAMLDGEDDGGTAEH
jgi:hypothetical protein